MYSEDYEDELSLGDYMAIIRRRWLWLVVPLVAISALTVTYTLTATERFSASARVVLAQSAAQEATVGLNQNTGFLTRELTNEVNFAYSDVVVDEVESTLGEEPNVDITVDSSSDTLIFTSDELSPIAAANAANVWAQTYVDAKRSQAQASIDLAMQQAQTRLADLRQQRTELRSDVDALQVRYDRASDPEVRSRLQGQIDSAESAIAADLNFVDSQISSTGRTVSDLELASDLTTTGEARVDQVAAAPLSSSNAPLSRNLALGMVVGLIVGVGAALLRESLDQRLKNAESVTKATGLPVLASIPDPGRKFVGTELALSTRDVPGGTIADAYARLRTSFQFAAVSSPTASVVVTSPNQSEGKTTTSANLAHTLAGVGARVVLADLDFRRPRIHQVYNEPQAPGFSDLLVSQAHAYDVSHVPDPATPTLVMMTAGNAPPDPSTFIASDPMGEAIRILEKEADILVLDAPPVLPVSDALALARHADKVLLVLNAKTSKRRDAEQAVKSLHSAGADIIGCVLVGVKASDGYGKYYGQGYK